ncbi:MAG TPA: prepilin-type N-terminal cleavage/methylation domain-containing protein [Vicinamibacterales bacterium]|nr:prepilin-type N-terminal cleavage/methylation domain-containing protein [Vicinamibacterales bacterium]HOG28665.1 prepilin-type N-terminal cleavage/methylation domain-containing protein [Vicinamibacterales bacterium]HPW19663.1 prepilin-type N-terminal cleavage/methylation domain-containing protein [Vicinamibacterales bacterium]
MIPKRARDCGFTLIEAAVILAVLAVLAAAITPMILQQIVEAKTEATRREARLLHEAMLGRPDVPDSFGFFGDMGRLPASFEELVRPGPGTALFGTATFRNVGMGWKGPYINAGDAAGDYLTDAFGRPYRGASAGQVRSAGPDGVFDTADDIVYPPARPNPTGRLMVTVKRMSSEDASYTLDPAGYAVRLYYSNGGVQASLDDAVPPFVFENVPQGVHAIAVLRMKSDPPQIVAQDTILVFGGGSTRLVELIFRP